MAIEAKNTVTDDQTNDAAAGDPVADAALTEVADGTEGAAAVPAGVDIVLDGGEGSQPQRRNGFQHRVNKLNGKIAAGAEQNSDLQRQLDARQEHVEMLTKQNQVLQFGIEQARAGSTPALPNPEDYDNGVHDPRYGQALQQHNQTATQAAIDKAVKEATEPLRQQQAQAAPAPDYRADHRQREHYRKAEELGADDYGEMEDQVLLIMGPDVVRQIVDSYDNSHILTYHLGKNPTTAQAIKGMIDAGNPIAAIQEVTRLHDNLRVVPRSTETPAPDPDTEISGGVSGASGNATEKRLDKLREKIRMASSAAERSAVNAEIRKIRIASRSAAAK